MATGYAGPHWYSVTSGRQFYIPTPDWASSSHSPRPVHYDPSPSPLGMGRQRFSPAARRGAKIPFDSAMDRLFTATNDAIAFYRDYLDRFESEIEAIKEYADSATLDRLWTARFDRDVSRDPSSGRRKPMADYGGGSDQYEESAGSSTDEKTPTLGSVARELYASYQLALEAVLPGKQQGQDAGSMERVQRLTKKVDLSFREVQLLCSQSRRYRGQVKELLKELEMFQAYLSKSRDLWRSKLHGDEGDSELMTDEGTTFDD